PWPALIPADVPEEEGAAFAAELATGGAPPPVDAPAAPDATPALLVPFDEPMIMPDDLRAGQRAALLIAHGTLRLFSPFFDVSGDDIDDRLVETLATVDAAAGPFDRAAFLVVLQRFAAALVDGNAFALNRVDPVSTFIPIVVVHLGDQPVIRRSAVADAQPGDAITAIDGRPVADWYAEELERTSNASHGYALDLASRRYLARATPLYLALRGVDGTMREASIMPGPYAQVPPRTEWLRPSGDLAAEDAPEVFYLNMSGEVEADSDAALARLDAAMATADALIIDVRGFPGVNQYHVVGRVLGGASRSPHFYVPEWTGPDNWRLVHSQTGRAGFGAGVDTPGFAGPIALLVGPTTVGAGENFSIMLAQAPQVTVIGRTSAGSNANLSGVKLPGGFALVYSGMEVRFPDDSPFHGVGIVPDMEVMPEAQDYVDGFDRTLKNAVDDVRARL
ncbi:MAG: hypothetical protein KC620_23605, partial [Myxococcales bacterium]|nr:hypothetical protein [Myxococcales bacterium]